MAFIDRNSLPPALRAAFDKAAAVTENDQARVNDKNDVRKIDSEYELSIFKAEVQKLFDNGKLDKYSYDSVNKTINSVFQDINNIKTDTKKSLDEKYTEQNMNEAVAKALKGKREQYEKEYPVLSYLDKLFNTDFFYKQTDISQSLGYGYDEGHAPEDEVAEETNKRLNKYWSE